MRQNKISIDRHMMQFFNTSFVLLNSKTTESTKKVLKNIKCAYLFIKLLICGFFLYELSYYIYDVYYDFEKYN